MGCGEACIISEHGSNTTELQQHYVFRAAHDLHKEHMHGMMIIEQQDIFVPKFSKL